MIRVLLAVVATVYALVLVLGYRTPHLPHDRLAGRVAVAPGRAGATAPHRCPPARVTTSVTGPWQAWRLGHLRVRVSLVGCRITDR